ncbi:MAG TPA: hypothetical protein VGN79_12490 [Devosia sp.]|jgi:hypothetical protein|nr:hypothetical protein [Devosia sp.]
MTSTANAELDQLIIGNLLDLDTASKRIEELTNEVWQQMCHASGQWAKDQGWGGEFDPDGDFSVLPPSWQVEGEKEAWFYLGVGPGDPEEGTGHWPYFWLTRYLGLGSGQLCLWLDQKVTGVKKWKAAAKTHAEEIAGGGFHLDDSSNFYLPCSLDAGTVATALADGDLPAATAPIREALDQAAKAKHLFDALLEQARQA